jgi:sugar lactone lactonase YvrE
MKTATFPGIRLIASLVRAVLPAAVATAILAAGNLFAGPTVKTLGGGYVSQKYGYIDTNTLYALFHTPMGLVANQSGTVFLADRDNNAVRELINVTAPENGNTYTFAPNPYATNQLKSPVGVVLDAGGNLYVLNRGGSTGVNTNGSVWEYNTYGFLIATNAAHLTNANAIAIDPFGNLYVTERSNLVVEISGGVQTLIAAVPYTNANLQGIAVMPGGNLAVCDSTRDGIYLITPGGVISTNAGFNGQGDGTGIDNMGFPAAYAQFFGPSGIASAGDGTLIVSDYGNDRVKVITTSGIVTNFYGVSSNDWDAGYYPGWEDGAVVVPDAANGVAARCPFGVALSPDGTTVYTTEDYYHIVRMVTGTSFSPPPTPPPSAPTGLTATIITNNGVASAVLLNWNAVASGNVTNYLVERNTGSGTFYVIGNTAGTTFTDDSITNGYTYNYVVQAVNSSGESPDSGIATVSIPVTPPAAPTIGWYDYEGNVQTGFFSTIHPVSPGDPYIANNPLNIGILPAAQGLTTKYVTVPPATNNASIYVVTNGNGAPVYEENQLYPSSNVNPLPSLPLSNGVVTVEAASVNGVGEASAVTSASFEFQVGAVTVNAPGGNAAQITLSDVTSNVVFYYTLDGTDPTNAPASQQVGATNGTASLFLNGTTNILFEVRAVGFGPDAGFLISGITSYGFSTANFSPNTISWGFAQGECSSAFIGAPGQTFYAPVTLTMLPGVPIYSLQFNMTISTSAPGITNPAPATDEFGFQSMLMQPIPGTTPLLYTNIPPYMFAGYGSGISLTNFVYYNGSTNYVDLVVSNGNELAVGWIERIGFTNLYNTLNQTLITYSLAHDDLFPDAAVGEPNGVIVGGYRLELSPNAVNGQQYQIAINLPSATDDGVGAPGSSVFIFNGQGTNPAALGPGTLNAIKNITVGSIPYLVGNVYPFRWFNAGDFGNTNLQNADVQQVFNSAIYGLNAPPYDPSSFNGIGFTNVSDMYDAMDSCGHLGYLDNNIGDEFYGYYTNAGPVTLADQNALFSGNYSLINNMVFGDGNLDVSDVYLTFLRSEFTNNFVWVQRLWTNGVRVAEENYAPGVIPAGQQLIPAVQQGGGSSSPAPSASSITNTPVVNFVAGDYQATAGQTVSIPVNATVFGPYPLRMLMLNISVVPLDGSPSLTTPISFSPSAALNASLGSATPMESGSSDAANYSAAWLPNSEFATDVPGFTGTTNIGTLYVTIPTNAISTSAYAIHFDHASASPSGLLSFPRRTLTGLITLSSRTNSYYGDGIPDSWRLRYFGTIYNELSVSNANADGTSMNNWQKYLAGLDPTDPTSVLNEGFDQTVAQSSQDHVLYWPSVSGQTYIIERSPTLFPPQWTTISTNIGSGSYMEIHDSTGGGKAYYEVTTP